MYVRRIKDWVLMGGQVDRHPQHEIIWTASLAFFLVLGIAFRFSSTFSSLHVLGYICFGIAAWILLSFWLPLPLIPIRNVEVVKSRRAERERKYKEQIKLIADLLAENRRLSEEVRLRPPP